jgi:N-acetylglucosaminyl-diphospho-decaprenol L-rhamnosyltransferase
VAAQHANRPQDTPQPSPAIACAIFVHWGDPTPTLVAVRSRVDDQVFDKVVVVANDGRPAPEGLPGCVNWEIPPRNLGYGAACQYAVERHPARAYAVLNADVTIGSADLKRCLQALDIPGMGIVGPLLFHPGGNLQSGCCSHTRYTWAARTHGMPTAEICTCDWVTGAAMVCRAEVLQEVRFDGSYFLLHEDDDLCLRARAAGWDVAIVSSARGVHCGGQTITAHGAVYYGARNRIWMARRHGGVLSAVLTSAWIVGGMAPRMLIADIVRRRPVLHSALSLRGLTDAWCLPREFGVPSPAEPIPARWAPW